MFNQQSNTSRGGPWLDQCMVTARDLQHPPYNDGQLRPTQGVAVQRIRNSYNPSAVPKFRRVIRRIGSDGQVHYAFIQDQKGVFNKDGTFARNQQQIQSKPTHSKQTLPQLNYDMSALENTDQDSLRPNHCNRPQITDNSEAMLLSPPDSPLLNSQRSTERVKTLQALLGDQIAETHGKAPPLAAPFFQSGAVQTARDLEVTTPVVLPVC